MAEKKRPRRTRERILETGLALFNQLGATRVTTADIADEMNISPGNLYYHFGNKEEIVFALYEGYEAQVSPLYADPGGRRIDADDLWLWLHLLFEQNWRYRFLYRDLDELVTRDRKLGARVGALLRKGERTVLKLCRAMVGSDTMRASDREIEALALNVILVASYWPSFDRIRKAAVDEATEPEAGRAAYQVLALFGPYLGDVARPYLDRLSADYL